MSNKLGQSFESAGNENNALAVTQSAAVPPPGPSSQLPSAIPSTSGALNQFVSGNCKFTCTLTMVNPIYKLVIISDAADQSFIET